MKGFPHIGRYPGRNIMNGFQNCCNTGPRNLPSHVWLQGGLTIQRGSIASVRFSALPIAAMSDLYLDRWYQR